MTVAIFYACAALAGFGGRTMKPSDLRFRAGVRGALFALCATLICLSLKTGVDAPLEVATGLMVGAAFLADAWFVHRFGPLARAVVIVPVIAHASPVPAAVSLIGAAVLARDMLKDSSPRRRAALQWFVFASSFGWLVPVAMIHASGRRMGFHADATFVLVLLFSSVLAASATRQFTTDGGGTPEPLDAPKRLVVRGVYRFIRHPIQLAEMGLMLASALLFRDPIVSAYAAVFAFVLVGPVRVYEERALIRRFGDDARRYFALVPAYGLRIVGAPARTRAS